MSPYRFPVFLAICVTCLGLAAQDSRQPGLALNELPASPSLTHLAQAPSPNPPGKSPSPPAQNPPQKRGATPVGSPQNNVFLWGAGAISLAGIVGLISIVFVFSRSLSKESHHFTPKKPVKHKENPTTRVNPKVTQVELETESDSPRWYVDRDESLLPVQTTTRLPNPDVVEQLIEDLRVTDPKQRRKAIWQLAQKSDSRAMKPLVDLMIDTDSQERSLILEALSQISSRTLKPMNQALAISLQDKNPQVRKNAIRDLTRIYDMMSQISQLLCHAIDDGDTEVQETAKWALTQLNMQMPPRLDMLSNQQEPSITIETTDTESSGEFKI
jgi:hypothetical protein